MPRITVGIPAYKTTFLVQAIASVLSQTVTDFELLISDDSPDGSVSELVRRFQDPRIRLIEGPRQGLVANSAHVWENARCDLLKFLYDDDVLFPGAIEELAPLLEDNPRYVFAFSRRALIDVYGRVIQRPQGFAGEGVIWFDPTAIAQHMMRTMINSVGEPSSMMIRRSAFPDASCLTAYAGIPIQHLIDVVFVMNAAERGSAVATSACLTGFRHHGDQVSSRSKAPGFVRGVIEWEVCLRGSVSKGIVPAQTALLGLPALENLYKGFASGFGETRLFLRDLPKLEELLRSGSRDVITDTFREHLHVTDVLTRARAAKAATEPKEDVAAEEPMIRGQVEFLNRSVARGWAMDPDRPHQPVRVEALVRDRIVGHSVADLDRPDLQFNLDSTRFGFELRFYQPLDGDELPSFRFSSGTERWLPPAARLSARKAPEL
ncbi:MAG: glycosyltransferase family 2 protein [Phenylobacterium sp.]